jgi:hypothetical protein
LSCQYANKKPLVDPDHEEIPSRMFKMAVQRDRSE